MSAAVGVGSGHISPEYYLRNSPWIASPSVHRPGTRIASRWHRVSVIRSLATFARSQDTDFLPLVWTVTGGAPFFLFFVSPILGAQYWFIAFIPAWTSIAMMLLRPLYNRIRRDKMEWPYSASAWHACQSDTEGLSVLNCRADGGHASSQSASSNRSCLGLQSVARAPLPARPI